MAEKKLRRLSRRDLVEIIYEVRKNEAALLEENEALKKQLEERDFKISRAGSLAELSASLNGLFEAAQATADQYLSEIRAAAADADAGVPSAANIQPDAGADMTGGVSSAAEGSDHA